MTGDEAVGMSGPSLAEHGLPAGDDLIGVTEVDLFGGQHRDTTMAVLGVVPAEERATEGLGLILIPELLAAAQNCTEVADENVTLGGPVERATRRRV